MNKEMREKAIDRYQAALKSDTLAKSIRASVQGNLAFAFMERTEGAKEENLQSAIDHFEQALTALAIEADREQWARARMGLATAYLAHPEKTRKMKLRAATLCRQAQRVFTRDSDPERWEVCEKIVLTLLEADPSVRAIKSLTTKWKEQEQPDNPFSTVPDQLLTFISDPEHLPQGETPNEVFRGYIELFAGKIRELLTIRLDIDTQADAGFLVIHVVDDWDINAQVSTQPPYNVYVSTNLVLFCATMSELLMFGMGLKIKDDDRDRALGTTSSKISSDEIANHLRTMIHAFLHEQKIQHPTIEAGPDHYIIAHLTFFSTMVFLVSHEFGHVVISEDKRRGKKPPFSDYAETMLRQVFDDLIQGRHHPFDPRGLMGREELDLEEVFYNWAEELTSDIIGASLALEFQSRHGPWASNPDILAMTKFGIHLAMVSQLSIRLCCNCLHGDYTLMSQTHPPMDFRTFCVLKWMYGDKIEAAEKPIADYITSIMTKVMSEPDFFSR